MHTLFLFEPEGGSVNKRFVFYAIGKLLQVLSLVLFIPLGIALYEARPLVFPSVLFDSTIAGFVLSILSAFLCGTLVILSGRKEKERGGLREGFAIVTLGWLLFTLFGCIPLFVYFISESETIYPGLVLRMFTDAYFEIMSGFTTTGATILTDIEVFPRGILFWRSMTHWLGGMGIVTLALAIFPAFGVAAYQMFRGEVPGPTSERLSPRLRQTATILWGVYVLLTLAETVLLWLGGMSIFESCCHAFGTMATGGFSTRNASIGAYNSVYIDWIVTMFMFFAGMNFILHYRIFFSRDFTVLQKDKEFRFYLLVIVAVIISGSVLLRINGIKSRDDIARSYRNRPLSTQELDQKMETEQTRAKSIANAVRFVTFQVVSITTTTGYCTADFDVWPDFLRFALVVLMFFGGCAGSTGGGMKMIRILVVVKTAWKEIRTMIQPRLILPIKIGKNAVDDKTVANILGFFALFLLLFVLFSAVMSFMVPDFTTAITTVVATMCNIGPGLSGIGATENYAWIPLAGKWVLILCMLLGRLEVYTVLIAFAPISWKK
ncbi:MAG: TrkH family potassium uptake protein [Chitinivibrionales bacterium]|nr:TrkH family potassium uptake protein [Chitinivibrionales bacterium]